MMLEAFLNLGSILSLLVVMAVSGIVILVMTRLKRIPPNKVIVISGLFSKRGDFSSAKCIHGGVVLVLPLIQSYQWLDLTPITIEIPLRGALSKQNIRVNVPARFTIGIATNPMGMVKAAERLLGLQIEEIQSYATDIILGQLRAVIATMPIEDINADRKGFEQNVMEAIDSELLKIGLQLINVNITDISDDSGYIEALGKKSASEAINKARADVAEQQKVGALGEATAEKEQRIGVANANADAVDGENLSLVSIAASNAKRIEAEAIAAKSSQAASLVQTAKAKEEGYAAEMAAEQARGMREEATRRADILVPASIEKSRIEIEAAAEAAKIATMAEAEAVRIAKIGEGEAMRIAKLGEGEAKAIRAKLAAEASGTLEILKSQAQGLEAVVQAAGGSASAAAMLLMAEKAPELYGIQAKALENIKIDKVVMLGGESGKGGPVSNFSKDFLSMLPQLHESAAAIGVTLPEVFGKTEASPASGKNVSLE